MSTQKQQNSSTTLLKKIVAGILAIVLCLVVWNNFIRNRSVTELAVNHDTTSRPNNDSLHSQSTDWDVSKLLDAEALAQGPTNQSSAFNQPISEVGQNQDFSNFDETLETRQWDIEEIVSHNPFAKAKKPKMVSTKIAGSAQVSQFISSGLEVESGSFPSGELPIVSEETPSIEPENVPPPQIANFTAIVTGGKRPAALINDQIVYENDPVGENWRIRQIHKDGILLEQIP